jgi:hypothetical protein
MAEEKLQYQVTFKTRAEGTGAQQTAAAVRDLHRETERLNDLSTATAQKVGANEAAYYDLSQSIGSTTAAVKVNYTAGKADDVQKARAIQTTRQLREEEAKRAAALHQVAAAAGTAGAASRKMAGNVQNVAFQVQDLGVQLAAGTSAATAFAQQLPQLLGGFGAGGAIAGGVVALGALAYKMATAGANTEEAKKQLEKYNEVLDALIAKKADEFVDAYAVALDTATQRTNDLAQAEINRLGTSAEVEAADRRKKQAQDDLTMSVLRYQQAVYGVDTTAEQSALKQAQLAREAEAAIAGQTQKTKEQLAAYNEQVRQIDELKASTAEWEKQIDDLGVKAAELRNAADLASRTNQPGLQGDLNDELRKVNDLRASLQTMLAEAPRQLAEMGSEAMRMAMQYDEMIVVANANIAAINAELEAKSGDAMLQEAIAANQKLTGDLTKAMGEFQATTPAQAQAAADLSAALADGKLTSDELARLSGQLATMSSGFTATVQGNSQLVDKLIAAVNDLAEKQKAQEAKIADLRNRR